MPSDKAAYLAAHYLNASSKPPSSSTKKRKRKQPTTSSGLLITDDDETGWGSAQQNNAEDDDAPVTIAGTTTADFRRTKKSTWKTISGTATTSSSIPQTSSSKPSATEAEADAILARAAADSHALAAAQDDPDPDPTPLMSNGARAGLQSASALTAQLRARQAADAAELAALQAQQQQSDALQTQPHGADTVILRDATGRRIDASLVRAQARRAAAEAAAAEQAKQDLLKGEVQQAAARARREALQDAALLPLARGRDDAEMNEEMKRVGRWHDPMAELLAASQPPEGKGKRGKGGRGAGSSSRPVYKGAAAPNRYGIRPGYRWDGVDRGNGFEGERFRALNRREMGKGLEYAWQMDE